MTSFTKYALKNIKKTGSVIPSSRFLARKIALEIPHDAKTIIELGAGDGVITQFLLKQMPQSATLTAYEISKQLLSHLEKIDHPNFVLRNASALDIEQHFAAGSVDIIISCLPIALFPMQMKHELLQKVKNCLRAGGLFVQYQYLPKDRSLILRYFPQTTTKWSALNAPPAFIYIGKKTEFSE